MSWSLLVSGDKATCIEKVKAAQTGDPAGTDEWQRASAAQAVAVKELLVAELEKSGADYNGKPKVFSISAGGHADAPGGSDGRTMNVSFSWSPAKEE